MDATVTRKMREHKYRVHFVPGVLLVNTETISLGKFLRWVQRQLIAMPTFDDFARISVTVRTPKG